jgi:DUF438 domain-containing protein
MNKTWSEHLIEDHNTTERVFEAVARALSQPDGPPARLLEAFRDYAVGYIDGCHNQKEERHLFPLIEKRGVPRQGGPLAVMLAEHEQSKGLLAQLVGLVNRYAAGDTQVLGTLETTFEQYTELLKGHFWKETDILYPMAQRVMSDQDARDVLSGLLQTEADLGPDTHQRFYALADQITTMGQLEDLSAALPKELIASILNTLPVELSFVDAEDTVRYFSHEHQEKIFPRTRGSIGVKVQQCHPQKSVHMVNQILADFKSGKRNVAQFWIDLGGRMIYIRYFPVRERGTYVGCLEVVQDITAIQKLEGQKRLLDPT